jgi:hypothetical protein
MAGAVFDQHGLVNATAVIADSCGAILICVNVLPAIVADWLSDWAWLLARVVFACHAVFAGAFLAYPLAARSPAIGRITVQSAGCGLAASAR